MTFMRTLVGFVLAVTLVLPIFATGTAETEGADDGEVTVTLGYNPFLADTFTDAPPPIEVIRGALAEQYPAITLEYYTMPQRMLDPLVIWMTSQDDTVDIYGMDVPWVTQFGRARWAVPLDDYIPEIDERITDAGLGTFSHEGERLGVPFWGSLAGLFYRTDILEEYGFEPPQTVTEMEEIITSVMADEPELSGFVWPGTREESLVMFYATALHAFGGSYTDEDGNLQLDTPESVRAVEWMRSTITRGLSPRSVQNWQRRESRQRFVAGEALFSWDNQDIITWLDDPEQSQVSGAWDFIPFPAQPEGRSVSVTGGFAFSVNPYSDDVDAAMKVLEVISSEKVQKGFALAWGPVQYYRGLYDDPEVREYNPNVEKLAPLVEIAINRPPSPNYGELSGILQEELNAAVTGTKSPEEAVRRMAERAAVLE